MTSRIRLTLHAAGMVLALSALVLCAQAAPAGTPPPDPDDPLCEDLYGDCDEEPAGFPDPLEEINRGTLRLNRQIDRFALDPVARVYRFVVPHPARDAVRRFLDNLNSPAVFANDILQREWQDANTTVARFAVNTTVGLAGLFDPAATWGFERHRSDFGQTLALEGMPSGPYLIVPVVGPTTTRDFFGGLVDLLFRPTTFVLPASDQLAYTTIHGSSSGIARRDAHLEEIEALEESSVDHYAALRSAYYQTRIAEIWQGRGHRLSAEGAARGNGDAGWSVTRVSVAGGARGEVGDATVDGVDERREALTPEN